MLRGRDRRARPHGDGHRRPDAAGARISLAPAPGRPTSSRSTTPSRPAPTTTSSAAASAATRVDLRGQILADQGRATSARYAPMPFFASSAGWGVRLASRAVVGARVPRARRAGTGCQVGEQPAVRRSRRSPTAPRSASRRAARRGPLRRLASRRRSPTTRPTRAGRRVPPPSELALIKWRDVVTGPDRGARGRRRASRRRGSRSAGCCSTTRGRPATARSPSTRTRFPDPAGLIRAGARARRALHALGLAEGDLRRRLPAGAPLGRPEPPGARPPQPGRRRRVPARGSRRSSRSASTASRATAATRSTWSASSPTLTERLPAALRSAPSWARCRRAPPRSSAPATVGSQAVAAGDLGAATSPASSSASSGRSSPGRPPR